MTYTKIKLREELTGCTCGSKKILDIRSPITGYSCPDCGATKDRYEKLKKAFAAAKAYLDELEGRGFDWFLRSKKLEVYEDAVRELEE